MPALSAPRNHPGVCPFIIHAADNPQLASRGLSAASEYAQIAPVAPHALQHAFPHFARLGLGQEDIASNLASLQPSQDAYAVHVGAENQLHAMEFEYAYLQIGEDYFPSMGDNKLWISISGFESLGGSQYLRAFHQVH